MPLFTLKTLWRTWQNRLRFLHGNFGLIVAWPLVAIAVSIFGWVTLMNNLQSYKLHSEMEALRNAAAFSRNYSSRVARTVEAIDEIMLHLRHEWKISDGLLNLEELKAQGMLQPSFLFNAAIFDRNGRVRTMALPPPTSLTADNKTFFLAQQFAEDDQLYIGGGNLGTAAKRDVIQLSRRITDANGDFDGVVMISVTTDYLVLNYDESILGSHGLLSIVGNDFSMRVTRIGEQVFSSDAPTVVRVPNVPVYQGSMLLEGGEWFADKRTRFLGWSKVGDYPLIAMLGLDQATVMAPYWASRKGSIQKGIWATLALGLFTLVSMVLSTRLAWRKHQSDINQSIYRVATEGGREGFIMMRPVWHRNGRVEDFTIMDCNQRAAEIIGQQRDYVVGKNISQFLQRPYIDPLLHILCKALDNGFAEEERKQPRNGPIKARWLHIKAVRAGTDLALTVGDISDSKAHVEELERRGNQDALTGLPNRHWVQGYLTQAIERAALSKSKLALLFIDLDGFKKINDSFGHQAGDELLRNAARRLQLAVRPHDHVVRFGGDEFVVILERLEHNADAAHVAERILHAFEQSFRLSRGLHTVGTSIGISVYPTDGKTAETLLQNADIAMYSVKTQGKRNYRFFEPQFYEALRKRLEREHELRHAIDTDQFVMYYQPRVDLASGKISSLEALVRWEHPTLGMVDPAVFISVAEETGMILELGNLVIDKVCAQLAQWTQPGKALVPVSINVSPRQFNHGDVGQVIAQALARHKIDPAVVEIELTESSMMGEDAGVQSSLLAIQELGIKILVDDFGTGYSSLSQLQTMDFDVLKVDQAFTARIVETEQGKVFFRAIITMAHALGMRVVAEGVENSQQVTILRALSCDEIQGYYISRPMPPQRLQPELLLRQQEALLLT